MSTADEDRPGWIGPPLGRGPVVTAFGFGMLGVLATGLQPLMLGSLLAAHRLNPAQLGHAATAELLALGIGAGAAGPLLEGRPLRPIGAVAALVYLAANLLTLAASGEAVALARALAGLPGGVMLWLVVGAIVRSPNPTRWAGIYLTSQTLAQLAVASGLSAAAATSTAAAPLAMAALGALAVAGALGLSPRYAPLPREETATGLPPLEGWLVLAAAVLTQAAFVGANVYLEPLGAQARIAPQVVSLAVPLALGAQVAGGTAATLLAGRVPGALALAVAATATAGLTLALAALPPAPAFLAIQTALGFCALIVLTFLTASALEADATRRTALMVPAANLIGAAAGPLLASALVGEADVTAAPRLCAALAFAGAALVMTVHLGRRRRPAAAGP